MTSAFRTYDYYIVTGKGRKNCKDRNAAEYLFSRRKHATIWQINRKDGSETMIATK